MFVSEQKYEADRFLKMFRDKVWSFSGLKYFWKK